MKLAPLAQAPLSNPATGDGAASAPNAFVFNLVSSTSPVALTRPDHAGLKRFTFFVSRRREEGRERFRLHMGYFDSQQDAEQLLDIVRSIYPGAWVGLAPGSRAISRAASAPALASAPAAAQPAVRPNRAAATATAAAGRAPTVPSAQSLALVPDQGRQLIADVTDGSGRRTAARSLSNVRDAIASLDDPAVGAPTVSPIPELAPAVIPTVRPVAAVAPKARKPERAAGDEGPPLTNSGVLRVLEGKDPQRRGSPETRALPRTQSRAEPRAERPYYAVQLLWAVKPIELAHVPQLAIFSAYVLYGAAGNREGRRWYGLRLGFFSDTASAKQVAQYVRADFASVSVVPVTLREREQALKAMAGRAEEASTAPAPGKRAATRALPKENEFEFIEDAARASPKSKTAAALRAGARAIPLARPAARADGAAKQAATPQRSTRVAAAKRRNPGQIQANARVKPKTLEETLDILGANQLEVDDEQGVSINDAGVRHLDVPASKGKPSKLSRLFGRLSERLGN